MNSNNSPIVSFFNKYEYLEKFVKNYKPLRSGMETLFSRHKKYYRKKLFDEIINNFNDNKNDINYSLYIFYKEELGKISEFYYNKDTLKYCKDFHLEINEELFINLLKYDLFYNINFNKYNYEYFYDGLENYIYSKKSFYYLTSIILLSFLLEKDIRDVKNIECLKCVYYIIGKQVISIYNIINLIYDKIIFQQSNPEIIYCYIKGFFDGLNKNYLENYDLCEKYLKNQENIII